MDEIGVDGVIVKEDGDDKRLLLHFSLTFPLKMVKVRLMMPWRKSFLMAVATT